MPESVCSHSKIMNSDKRKPPDSVFVRDTYDTLLEKLPQGYSEFRWNENVVSRFHYRQSRRALLRALATVPVKMGRALEVGGGGGAWTPFFAARAAQVDFLDISGEMLREAQSKLARFQNIRYMHTDFLEWEPEPAAYDLVVSIRNLEYMQDTSAVLARMSRALRQGGTLILSTKNPQFDWKGYFDGKALHGGQIPVATLTTLLHECGFAVTHIYPAIIGKRIRYAPMRFIWDVLQRVSLRLPRSLVPLSLLKYISESFLIVAQKI